MWAISGNVFVTREYRTEIEILGSYVHELPSEDGTERLVAIEEVRELYELESPKKGVRINCKYHYYNLLEEDNQRDGASIRDVMRKMGVI